MTPAENHELEESRSRHPSTWALLSDILLFTGDGVSVLDEQARAWRPASPDEQRSD